MIYWPDKAPGDTLDLGADWSPTLSKLPGNQLITASTWELLAGDCATGGDNIGPEEVTTGLRVGGGSSGTVSIFRNYVTLSDGQVLHEDAMIKVL